MMRTKKKETQMARRRRKGEEGFRIKKGKRKESDPNENP
jgi:hypothetical protein